MLSSPALSRSPHASVSSSLLPPVHPLSLSFACVAMDGSRTPSSDPDPAAIGKDDLEYEASLRSLLKQEKAARSAAAGSGAPTVVAAPVDPWEAGRLLLSPDLASMGSPSPLMRFLRSLGPEAAHHRLASRAAAQAGEATASMVAVASFAVDAGGVDRAGTPTT